MDHNKLHILEAQTENGQYQCNVCDKTFTNNTILHEHMDMHKREKQYQCNFCYKMFVNDTILLEHMEVHKIENPFKCNLCGNSFQSDTSLNEHMEIHNLVKPFQSIHIGCSDPFVNNTALKENMAHAEEKHCSAIFVMNYSYTYKNTHWRETTPMQSM